MYARGTIVGITRGTTAAHITRATLESIALQTLDVVELMERETGVRMPELRVDGGAVANDLLMQIQADVLAAPRRALRHAETTALGAAYLAGLAVGFWKRPGRDRRNLAQRRPLRAAHARLASATRSSTAGAAPSSARRAGRLE